MSEYRIGQDMQKLRQRIEILEQIVFSNTEVVEENFVADEEKKPSR